VVVLVAVIAVLLVVLAGAGGSWFLKDVTHDPASAPLDPWPQSSHRMIAIGDSYMSGEGAQGYFSGSDDPPSNKCRRAPTAYAWLLAEHLEWSLTFAACSGARTGDITKHAQYPHSDQRILGGEPQIDVLRHAPRPFDAVLVGIGGNDAGFGDIGRTCLFHNCLPHRSAWLAHLSRVEHDLEATYRKIDAAAQGAPVVAVTYPQPLAAGESCVPLLTQREWVFLRDQFVPRLNAAVVTAARATGVSVIDLSHAFEGRALCDGGKLSKLAVTFIGLGRTKGSLFSQLRQLPHPSLHPTDAGHFLLYRKVLAGFRELVPAARS
jgi:hypothetical protein